MREQAAEAQQCQVVEPGQFFFAHGRQEGAALAAGAGFEAAKLRESDAESIPMRAKTQSNQAEQAARKRIGIALESFAALEWQIEAILLPGPVKKRYEAMVEKIEPVLQGRLLRPL